MRNLASPRKAPAAALPLAVWSLLPTMQEPTLGNSYAGQHVQTFGRVMFVFEYLLN